MVGLYRSLSQKIKNWYRKFQQIQYHTTSSRIQLIEQFQTPKTCDRNLSTAFESVSKSISNSASKRTPFILKACKNQRYYIMVEAMCTTCTHSLYHNNIKATQANTINYIDLSVFSLFDRYSYYFICLALDTFYLDFFCY